MTSKIPPLDCPPEGRFRVGLCQVGTAPLDLEGNLARTLAALAEAAAAGAHLAITPECVLSGYPDTHDAAHRARALACSVSADSSAVRAVAAAAAHHRMAVTLGFAELDPATGLHHNTALLIGADGREAAQYRKVHCRDFETEGGSPGHDCDSVGGGGGGIFTPGDRFAQTADVAGHLVGLMICFDREIPESVRCLRALGARLVACPLATDTWCGAEADGEGQPGAGVGNETVTRVRAAENEVFIAVVNHAGRFNGGSYVVAPDGAVVARMDRHAGTSVVEIPLGAVGTVLHGNPRGWMGWGYRRREVYAPCLGGRGAGE